MDVLSEPLLFIRSSPHLENTQGIPRLKPLMAATVMSLSKAKLCLPYHVLHASAILLIDASDSAPLPLS